MSENPGGWPTGPMESASQRDRRQAANAAADLRQSVIDALTPLVSWLARHLPSPRS